MHDSVVSIDPLCVPLRRTPVGCLSSAGTPYTRWVPNGMPDLGDYKQLLDSVVFLYPTEQDARAGSNFGATGFIVQLPVTIDGAENYAHGYVVSNWHAAVRDGLSVVRVNKLDGDVDVFGYGPENWFFEPGGHDIAILPIKLNPKHHRVTALAPSFLSPPEQKYEFDTAVGDDVFMVGRFVDYVGHETNEPAVRFGNVSMAEVTLKEPTGAYKPCHVVDMHSRTGFSGSPVFVYRSPNTRLIRTVMSEMGGHRCRLLGIHWGQFPEEWEIGEKQEQEADKETFLSGAAKNYIKGLSGMTCICPAEAVWDLINAPPLQEKRRQDEEAIAQIIRKFGRGPTAE